MISRQLFKDLSLIFFWFGTMGIPNEKDYTFIINNSMLDLILLTSKLILTYKNLVFSHRFFTNESSNR